MNTPTISPRESFLDTKVLVKNPVAIFEKYRKKLGPVFEFRFGGLRKTLVVADPDFLRYILKENNDNYFKSHIQVKRFVEFQGVGLTNSHKDYWFRQRRLLSMGFTRSRLTDILPIQLKVLSDFISDFDKAAKQGPVDIHEQMVKFTLRSVGKSLFGSQMNEVELERFAAAIADIQQYILKKVIKPYLHIWYRIGGQDKKYQEIRKKADQIIVDYIEKRIKDKEKESDILQLMLDTPYKDTDEHMTDESVRVEILQLLVAGNETSTTASTWAFYLLAKHSEYIPLMRQEIKDVFGDGEIDYAGLFNLSYTSNVLDEAMRVNPPFWMIDREAVEDDEYMGINIPKGTTVVPYIYGVHHNEKVWKSPEVFDPSRFDRTINDKIHPFAHIPFGGGPRVCIGQNMARMQMLLVISAVIRQYDMELCSNREVGHRAMMLLKPDGPIYINFSKVKN